MNINFGHLSKAVLLVKYAKKEKGGREGGGGALGQPPPPFPPLRDP